jgi:hypothetical protein
MCNYPRRSSNIIRPAISIIAQVIRESQDEKGRAEGRRKRRKSERREGSAKDERRKVVAPAQNRTEFIRPVLDCPHDRPYCHDVKCGTGFASESFR